VNFGEELEGYQAKEFEQEALSGQI